MTEVKLDARGERLARALRRREVGKWLEKGETVGEIARRLHAKECVIRRDVRWFQKVALLHDPWGNPLAVRAGFIEAAENALRRVRELMAVIRKERDGGEADEDGMKSTLYLNLMKLEWTMLIRFIDMLAAEAGSARTNKGSEGIDDEERDWTKCSDGEIIEKARELGIDVAGFERALGGGCDEEDADEGDCGEAA